MSTAPLLSAMSSRRIASLILGANHRVIYAAPGIQLEAASTLVSRAGKLGVNQITVSLDFDEHTLRMGYGSLAAVEKLRDAGITPSQSPGLRSGILIVDERGWVFTPTALYLEMEPQSDETPNAVELTQAQVATLAIRLSPKAQEEAIAQAGTPEAAREIASINQEIGIAPVASSLFNEVKASIQAAPPVKFNVVRQVRVFEPYLQYVELSLTGAAVQRRRVQIPKALQNLGTAKDLEGKLKTTFDLIEKGSSLSSKALEDELNGIRRNFTPSLGKDHGRVVLKVAKPKLLQRLTELRGKLDLHQKKVEEELQAKLDLSKKQVVEYYLPLVRANPPDELIGSTLSPSDDNIQFWLEETLSAVFPRATELIQRMVLEERYKDVTFETLNRPDFLESVKAAFPRIDWDKPFCDFKAASESGEGEA